jgi:ribosomal protein L40E
LTTTLENLLTSFFIQLPNEIRQSLEFNHGISFDAGVLGERIKYVLNGTKGTASNGGGSFDSTDGSEAKAVFFAQPSTCKKCGAKVNYYAKQCHCGSTDLKPNNDTRWGIDCKAHFQYLEQIPFYQFVSIRPLNKDIDCLRFQLDVYRVDSDNIIFNEILRKQIEKGSKPHKNFMPFGRDFYMSSPTHILSVVITITDNCSYDYKVNDPQKLTTIPTHLFTKDEQKVLPRVPSLDVISAHQLVGLGKSSHGKPRGITTRKTK